MADKEWWEKGQYAAHFNQKASQQEINNQGVENDDYIDKPPVLGLQGGPTPPGEVRDAADAAARAQAAREHYFANLEAKVHNETTIENNDLDNDQGTDLGGNGDQGR